MKKKCAWAKQPKQPCRPGSDPDIQSYIHATHGLQPLDLPAQCPQAPTHTAPAWLTIVCLACGTRFSLNWPLDKPVGNPVMVTRKPGLEEMLCLSSSSQKKAGGLLAPGERDRGTRGRGKERISGMAGEEQFLPLANVLGMPTIHQARNPILSQCLLLEPRDTAVKKSNWPLS